MASSVWGSTPRGTLLSTTRIGGDISSSSGPGYFQGLDVFNGVLGQIVAGTNVTVTPNTGTGTLTIAATGGGSSPLTTKGDLYGFDTAANRIPVGTNGQALLADSTQALGVRWGSVSGSGTVNSGTANQVAYYNTTGTAISGLADVIYDGTAHKYYFGPNGLTNPALTVDGSAATLVNGMTIAGAATGNAPSFIPSGSDTNIGILIQGKGTGAVVINAGSTLNLRYQGVDRIVCGASTVNIPSGNTLTVVSNATVGGTLVVTGLATANGGLKLGTAGNKLTIVSGTNATHGTATLSAGTVTVSTTAVTANSQIYLTAQPGTNTNIGIPYVSTITAGTSFVITSSNNLDTATIAWLIIDKV